MNPEITSAAYGLRSSYRLAGTTEVITQDFFGPTKGEESAKFIASTQGKVDYQLTQVILPE